VTHAELAEIGIVAAPRNALGERLEVPCESAVTVSTDDDAAIAAMVAAGVGATAMPALSLRAGAPAGTRILELVPPVSRVLGAALTAKSGPGAELLVRSLS
jgi:DNA-binding transcriptional LysR family regulator